MPPFTDIQELLTHAEWLRGLARHLVRDEADAADAVQQTWAAALRSPPDADRPARPWLAQVLRNFVRKNTQRTRNRGARERAVSEPDATALSSEALLESMQLQRLLGELVVALEEPYRSAILLRYYEGLEPARIAEMLGVPAGTIRWRVSEGISRLRAALDKRKGEGWRLALVPLLGEPPTGKGALVAMGTKTKISLVAAAVGVSLVGGGLAWRKVAAEGRTDVTNARARSLASSPVGSAGTLGQPSSAQAPAVREAPTGNAPPRFVTGAGLPAAEQPAASRYGTMSKDDIRAAMRATIPAVKACYGRFLENNPGVSGRINVKFTIVEKEGVGRVSEATMVPLNRDGGVPELVSPLTEQCILNAIADATFAAPVGGPVIVTYPFLLAPKPPPDGAP